MATSLHAIASSPSIEIDQIVNEALEEFYVPGAAVGIVVEGQIVLAKGYGSRNVKEGLPVTPYTLFRIASCTKAFTASLLVQLADEGRISLDDPVRRYIPEFALFDEERAARLTVRDLLAHRTGIVRHDPIWLCSEMTQSEVVRRLPHLKPVGPLGEEFQYNNLMYVVAGMIIERVTGESWEEALSSRLFKPLGMGESNASVDETQLNSDYSLPYAELDGEIAEVPFRRFAAVNPAGGINSNITDMSKWIQFQLANGPSEAHQLQMPFASSDQGNEIYRLGYGLGWFIGRYKERDLVSHGGDIDGFGSEVVILHREKIGLVILANSSSDGRYAIASIRNQLLDLLLGLEESENWVKKAQEARNQSKRAIETALSNDYQTLSQTEHLAVYTGSYHHPAYGEVEIKIEDGGLVSSYGRWSTPLYNKSEHLFAGQFRDLLFYGISPVVEFIFSPECSTLAIPFESFRNFEPIVFTKSPT